MARRNMITCVYMDDDSKEHLKRMDGRYQSQLTTGDPAVALFGAVPATLAQVEELTNAPNDLKPRTVLVRTTTGDFTGRIAVFTPGQYIALTPGTPVVFYDGQGANHAGQVYGHEGERSNHKTDVA